MLWKGSANRRWSQAFSSRSGCGCKATFNLCFSLLAIFLVMRLSLALAAAVVASLLAGETVSGTPRGGWRVPREKRRNNILFLMSDSHDGRTLDPTDATVFPAQHLPNLRRLASRGTNFVRTYAHSPQCTPSRSSMYTGRVSLELLKYEIHYLRVRSRTSVATDAFPLESLACRLSRML